MADEEQVPQSQESGGPEAQAEQPAAGAEQPAAGAGQPAAGAEQPAAGAEQPAAGAEAGSTGPGPGSKEVDKDARQWAMFSHLAGLCALLPVVPIVGGIIGPLIIWQMKKEQFPFVGEQGRESVNFQISILIYGIAAGLLCFACIGFVLLPAVYVFDLVFLIIAAVKANDGEHYRYPLTIRFLK